MAEITLSIRFADYVYVDTIAIGQRMGSYTSAGHKIWMDSIDVHLDTVLRFPCGPIRMESSEYP